MLTAVISAGPGPARPLSRAPEPLDLSRYRMATFGGGELGADEVLAQTHTRALLVLREDEVVAQWYAEPELEHTPLPLHSITKSWVGVLAGQLLAEGRLEEWQLASHYVPELAGGGYAQARIRDLLDMRTGGDYVEEHHTPGSELDVLSQRGGWGQQQLPEAGSVSVREYLTVAERVAVPGGPFSYRSLDTEVLGWVLEAAGGADLRTLLAERLYGRIGAEADAVLMLDGAGDPIASGGLSTTASDLARFGLMLRDSGAYKSRQIVPTMFLKDTRMGADDSVAAFGSALATSTAPARPSGDQGMYRNQFWVPARGGSQLLALGVHGQAMLVDSARRVVAVKLSGWPHPQDPELFSDGLNLLQGLADLVGEPAAGPEILR